jgi:flagellar assembly protein FliH
LSSKVFKNYQVNLGVPFMVKVPEILNSEKLSKPEQSEYATERIEEDAAEVCAEDMEKAGESIILAAQNKAQMIIKEAEQKALKILNDSEIKAEAEKASVLEKARKEGFIQGEKEAKKLYRNILDEAEKIKQEAIEEYDLILSKAERDAVEIILEIARIVVGKELSDNSESILNMIKQSFDKCSNRESILLLVSPDDYDIVEKNIDKIKAMVEGIHELNFKIDHALGKGSFVIRTPYGNIEGGEDKQLKKIEEAFKEVLFCEEACRE